MAPTLGELRAFLQEMLPAYMVPSAFVALEALPLTPNGKLDRQALPAPGATQHQASGFVAPRDALEQQLVDIWQECLGVNPIGVTDDYFDIGGHSLLALRFG